MKFMSRLFIHWWKIFKTEKKVNSSIEKFKDSITDLPSQIIPLKCHLRLNNATEISRRPDCLNSYKNSFLWAIFEG